MGIVYDSFSSGSDVLVSYATESSVSIKWAVLQRWTVSMCRYISRSIYNVKELFPWTTDYFEAFTAMRNAKASLNCKLASFNFSVYKNVLQSLVRAVVCVSKLFSIDVQKLLLRENYSLDSSCVRVFIENEKVRLAESSSGK